MWRKDVDHFVHPFTDFAGRLNVLSPPLILTTDQIDWLVDTLRAGIEEDMTGLKREGLRHKKV